MAASTQQKVDFLLKKIGYTASKTGLAEDSSLSGTKKAPFAEAVPSPLVIATSSVWADSGYIPASPPASSSSYVQVYLSGTSGHHMTVDSTVSGNRAYIAYSTYNNSSTAILGDWIDTQFGASYIIKVYKGDPNSGGVSLSAAGSGSNDGWFFDYSSGILNFNDTNVPSGVTDSNIYVVGYRYIGGKGVLAPAGIGTFNSLEVSGVSTFSAAVDANAGADISGGVGLNVVGHTELDEVNVSGVSTYGGAIDANAGILASTLKVEDLTASRVVLSGTGGEIEDNSKLTFTTDKLAVTGGLTVSAGATFSGIVDGNAGADISGGETTLSSATVSDLTSGRITYAGGSGSLQDSGNLTFSGSKLTVTGNAQVTTDLDVDGGANISGGIGLNVVGHTEVDEVNVSGVSTYGGAIDANAGIDVSGHTELDNVNVSGVSTYSAAADFNAGADISGGVGLNVVGHTELDEVNASGVSTFAALIDGDGGANISGGSGLVASTAKISDLTDNRVVLAGASGELEDSSSITFDGSTFAIVGGATFTGNVTVGGTLTSEDKTNVDSVGLITARTGVRITSGGLIVSAGVNTFTDAIDANGGANISGGSGLVASSAKISDLTSGRVVVAGTDGELEDASTFTFSGGTVSATAFSGTNLTGTLQTAAQPNVTSLGTIANLVASRAQVTGVGGLVITGVSTFTGAVDANGGADISGGVGLNVVGHSELDEVNVSGVSTYAGAIDANAGAHISGGIGLEVVGHTEVDNFSASGVSTFAALVDGNAGANFSGAETVLSSATVSDLTENRVVIAGADGALEDASTLTFDGTKLQVGTAITMYQATGIVSASYFYGDGSNLLNAGSLLSASSGVQRIVTTSLTSGTMTSAGTDADLNFDTSSNTLNAGKVNVAGVGTFGGLVDGNAGCNFSGAESTFSSATVSDLTDNRVVIAGTSGALEDSGNLTFDGTTLTVTGNASVTTDLNVDGGANISGGVGLEVVGHTELDEVNVSGVSTYGGAADFNAGVLASTLKVEDLTASRVVVSGTGGEIEDSANLTWVSNGASYLGLTGGLTVSAASTFSGIVDGNAGANFSGAETTLSSATVSDLTSGRVVVAGTSGALEDASTFTFSGGTVSATAFSATDLTGTLQTAAQGNVTSLGTLTGLAINGDLDLYGPAGVSSVTWDKSDNALEFADHVKATFGNSGDLEIYHDGTTNYIRSNNGDLVFRDDAIDLKAYSTTDTYISCVNGGAVSLRYDNGIKFQTTFTGAIVTGILTATSFTGTLNTAAQTNVTSVGTLTGLDVNGDASLYGPAGVASCTWDKSDNALEFLDHAKATFGTGNDLSLYHDGANANIYNTTGELRIRGGGDGTVRLMNAAGNEHCLIAEQNKAVTAYYNNSKKFETSHTGAIVTGIATATSFSGGTYTSTDWFVNDTAAEGMKNTATGQFFFSQASNETRLYHGSNAQVKLTFRGSGDTYRGAVNADAQGIALLTGAASEEYGILCAADGATNLYWDASKKFETTYHGAIVTGILTATTVSASTASFSSDVDIADTLYHTGDTNTSIRFPADDTFSVTTAGSEALRVDSNQRLIIGHTASVGEARSVQLVGTSADTSSIQLIRHSNDTGGAKLDLTKSRDTSKGSNTIVQDDDCLGDIAFRADDGTDFNTEGARISAFVDGTPGENDMPGRLRFSTTPDGASTPVERLRINSTGQLELRKDQDGVTGRPDNRIVFKDTDTSVAADQPIGEISWHSSDSGMANVNSWIRGINEAANGSGSLRFGVKAAGSNEIEALRITSAGKIGVGTDPSANFEVYSDTPGETAFAIHADLGTNNNRTLNLKTPATDDANEPYIWQTGNSIQWQTDSNDGIIVAANGKIGLNTDDPATQVDILGDFQLRGAAGVSSVFFDQSENTLNFKDHVKTTFGTDGDLSIYHDATNDRYSSGTLGDNIIASKNKNLYILSGNADEAGIRVYTDGKVDLSYNGTPKLETTSTGVQVQGLTCTGNNPVSMGSTTVSQLVLKDYTETVSVIGDTGTSATLNLANGNVFTATLTGNCTFTFTTGVNRYPNAQSFTLILANDTTPSRTISWPASVKWPNNSAPSRTTAASKTDIWTFMTPDNGTTWYGNIALYNFT